MTLLGLLAAGAPASAQGGFDIPTGAPPSPLFGAQPFSQRMLLFEEFGLRPMPTAECADCPAFPPALGADSGPTWSALDAYLAARIDPLPKKDANLAWPNAWENLIAEYIRPFPQTYREGRPPGEWFSHQRWGEFKPELYFESAQAGAHANGGVRDAWQLHGYKLGEFGPGGLYHNTTGGSGQFNGTTAGIEVRLHPNMPVQDQNAVWTFDGTLPPKLLMARYGHPLLFRHHNALPIDPAANYGFGSHTISTHEHNGHSPAESDGYTHAFFYPGQFFDYRWPMILAGHDSINTAATNPRAGTPDGKGGIEKIRGDWRETMSTHWFHDHMLDFTAQNVYKGNAAMFNYYSAIDRGNEGLACHYEDPNNVNLCFPSGTALDWGNRDYDVNLLVADKAWDQDGQLFFNIFNLDGFLGDRMTVNWLYNPYFEVRARRYRLRILNGSVSRYMKIAVVTESGARVPFHMIANDGNIMEHAVAFPNALSADLPTQAIAERYDIVIDFAQFAPGTKIYLVNLLEHKDGRGPNEEIPLQEVLSGAYEGDPAVGKFLEFRVVNYKGQDRSMNPADYVEGKKKMIPLPGFTAEELANARHRTFEFGRSSGTDTTPWTIKTDGGQGFGMDPQRLSAAPNEGDVEIWHLENGGGGWSHPIHIHFEEGQILSRDGSPPPPWEKWARKDVYRIGNMPDSGDSVVVALRFREFLGTYMEHCHNTQHEDHAMLLRWDIENPGQLLTIPTPMPGWEGVLYEPSFTLETYKTGDVDAAANFPPSGGTGSCTITEDPEASCSDGVDNDCDLAVDEADADCQQACTATQQAETSCSDGVDNDCDGLVDAADPDCTPVCLVTEQPESSCSDGLDNDCDGLVDGNDLDCQAPVCTLGQSGDSCSNRSDCCSGACTGKKGAKTCR